MSINISTTNSTPQYLTDLEKCGIATSNNLREILTTCSDPVEAIKQFQLANNVQVWIFYIFYILKKVVKDL